jgi:hypothetical protein
MDQRKRMHHLNADREVKRIRYITSASTAKLINEKGPDALSPRGKTIKLSISNLSRICVVKNTVYFFNPTIN